MKDDYLWDRTGEADAETERLEKLLGDFRYRRPAARLPLPERTTTNRPTRTFLPTVAIAASLLFLLLAGGIWLSFGGDAWREAEEFASVRLQPSTKRNAPGDETTTGSNSGPAVNESKVRANIVLARLSTTSRRTRAKAPTRRWRTEPSPGQLANSWRPSEREAISVDEGIAAREQLIKALHLASSKLNLVQKKVQDNKATGPVS